MPTMKQIIFASVLVCALLSSAVAQESTSLTVRNSSLTITAAAAGERVRITAPSSIVQIHVEVYAASGEKLFDQEIRGGNVFDWNLQDGQGQRLAPGTYVCVVTAKNVSGKLTQKIGTVNVEEKSASVQPAASLSAPQAQTIGPVEENSSWTIPGTDDPQTPTVIAHDGTDGQMIRGRGALTFRIGNFFTGIDTEQMRLTEDGRLGIGTSVPRATLDVAGTIRAQRFLVAKPKQTDSANTTTSGDMTQSPDAKDSVQPLASGTGTQDRIAKWTDNSGTLGDSGITETVAGLVGIGTTTPDSKLVVSSNSATLPPAASIARFAAADGVQTAIFADAFGTNPLFNVRRANGTAANPSALQANQLLGVIGASGYGSSAYTGTRARVGFWASENWTNTANGTYLTLNTTANGAATAGGTERVRIDNAGNVGIGTPAPTARLAVRGNGTDVLIGDAGCGPPTAAIGFGTMSGCNNFALGGDTGSTFPGTYINAPAGNGIHFRVANTADIMTISSGGVGLGTPNPNSAKLEAVTTNSTIGLRATTTGGGTAIRADSNNGWFIEGDDTVTLTRKFHIDLNGTYTAGSDFAEALPALGDRAGYEPGDVLVVSTKAPGKVEKASRPYDRRVAGIYSTRPGMLGADKNGTSRVDKDDVPVAIVGVVPAKVSAMNGRIRAGDLLTTSSMPGYAMRCTNRVKCVGAIVGKALEPLAQGQGVIKVLVMLR